MSRAVGNETSEQIAENAEGRLPKTRAENKETKSGGGFPERSKGSDCKSDGNAFEGSNPSLPTLQVTNEISGSDGRVF